MKVFKYLFISSIMFAVTSCGNDWLDLAPSTTSGYRNQYQCFVRY